MRYLLFAIPFLSACIPYTKCEIVEDMANMGSGKHLYHYQSIDKRYSGLTEQDSTYKAGDSIKLKIKVDKQ